MKKNNNNFNSVLLWQQFTQQVALRLKTFIILNCCIFFFSDCVPYFAYSLRVGWLDGLTLAATAKIRIC